MGVPTQITVTGTVTIPSGPEAGRLVFASTTLVRDNESDDVMRPHEIEVAVPSSGEFSVDLSSTDDPRYSPTGWTWEVRPHFPGWKTPFSVAVPYDSPGGALTFSELVAIPPDGTGDLYALAGHVHAGGGGADLTVVRRTVTTGNLALAASTPWIPVSGGSTISIAAAVGDYLAFEIVSMLGNFSTNFVDLAVLVGGSIIRTFSTDTATPAVEGAPPFYGDQSFDRYGPVFEFAATADDISGGTVTIGFITQGSGGGTIYASTDYPLRWRALNHGSVTVS